MKSRGLLFCAVCLALLTARSAPAFTLLTYNQKGNGASDWSTNSAQVQAIGRQMAYLQPDVITLVEVPAPYFYQVTNFVNCYLPGYYLAINSIGDGYIMSAIASRYPITRSTSYLHQSDLTPYGASGYRFTRDLFEAQISVPGSPQPFHAFVTHLKASSDSTSMQRRAAEAGAISNFFYTGFLTTNASHPYTLSGDLNEDIYRPPAGSSHPIERLVNAATGLQLTTPVNPYTADDRTISIQTGLTARFDYILPCGMLASNITSSQVFRTDLIANPPPPLKANDDMTASDHLPVLMTFHYPTTGSPPAIVQSPTSQMVCTGALVDLSCIATGVPPPVYQWRKDGLNVGAATTNTPNTLTFSSVTTNDAGNYSVVVANAAGSITSAVATLTVTTSPVAPWITAHPQSQTAITGDNVTFSSSAMGTTPLNYQWQFNGTNVDGATNSSLLLTNVQMINRGNYHMVVTNVAGSATSSNAFLELRDFAGALNATNLAWTTAGNAPWFVQSAVTHDGVAAVRSGAIVDNQQSTLQTAVTGPGTLSFWWKVSSENYYDYLRFYTNAAELAAISGEVGWERRTFYLGAGAQTLRWVYSKDESVSSGQDAGWLDEVTFLAGATPATIASPLANQSVAAGIDVTLTVSAIGTPPLSYQWQFNGTNLPGATGPSLVLRNVQAVNTGDYGVVVRNGYGTNSSTARLTVNPSSPVILVPPSGQLAATRGSGAFTVTARGSEPLAYQWQFNGTNIAGATNSTLAFENIQAASAGGYRVTVSNAYGVTVSSSAVLVVGPAVVVAWGDNSYGQTNVPLSLTNMTAVVGGLYHCLALRSSGTLAAWGDNGLGQTSVTARATNVTAIAAGGYHNLALRADGSVVAWGYNGYGQTNVPPVATNVTSVAAGAYHSLASRGDGMALAWGYNGDGEANVPARATNSVAVAAGMYHSLALQADGTVVAWGYNGYGQTNVPSRATNVVAIAAGAYHSLALQADGTVVAWGYNGDGETNVPSRATNVVAIAAGAYHSLALRADGTVVAWGYNGDGETNVPTRATNVVAIAGGAYHSLSIVNDGSPFLVRQPGRQTVMRGNTAAFRAAVLGDSPLNYQWRLNGIDLAGATNSSLNLPSAQPDQAGNYTLIVTNTWGAVTSRVAVLTVLSAPWITEQPPAQTLANEGTTFTLRCVAGGTPPLSYQWRHNGTNIPTATSDSLVLANLRLADGGVYSVRVTNAFGSVTSTNALLTVNQFPVARCRDVAVSAGPNCLAAASVDNGSFDPDGDPITVMQLPSSPYPPGTNLVILSVADNHGLTNTCTAMVIVRDTTPPTITCPTDIMVTNAHSAWTSVVTFSPAVADNCSGVGLPVCTPPSGSAFGLGGHPVMCSVTDEAGNSNSCSFQVTVWPGNQPPVPAFEVAPLARFPGDTNLIVIAPDGKQAHVFFDASKSWDPDDATFRYFWYEGTNLFGTNVVATNWLALGSHEITLLLDDTFPLGTNSASATVQIISPSQAVDIVIGLVEGADLPRNLRPLLASLEAARASFDRGNTESGFNELQAFQNKVRAQVAPLAPVPADNFIQAAQQILDALSRESSLAPRGKISLTRQPDGKVRVRFTGPAGQVHLIQASTNLVDWEMIGVGADRGDGSFDWEDPNAVKFPKRYYRLVRP